MLCAVTARDGLAPVALGGLKISIPEGDLEFFNGCGFLFLHV